MGEESEQPPSSVLLQIDLLAGYASRTLHWLSIGKRICCYFGPVWSKNKNTLKIRYYFGWTVEQISQEDQLFLTLCKLRCNFRTIDLGLHIGVSHTTISNVLHTWISVLHEILCVGMLPGKLPSVKKNLTSLPSCFSTFSSCRVESWIAQRWSLLYRPSLTPSLGHSHITSTRILLRAWLVSHRMEQ